MSSKDYEVRKTIHKYGSIGKPEPEDTYDSINFMVYLLGDIKYKVVYDDLERFLQELKKNVDEWPSAMPQKRVLELFIADLRAKLLGKSILLRQLFEKILPAGDTHYFVVEAFQKLANDSSMQALCLPFLHVQDGSMPPISTTDMDFHIKHLGKYSLYNLFTKSKKSLTDLERAAVKKARELGIFSYPPTKDVPFKILDNRLLGGGSNHRTCDPNTSTCVSSTSGWCNADASGNCSALST